MRLIQHFSLDFPALNNSSESIPVNSTGNLDCNAFAASVVNSTSYDSVGVFCYSKKGDVTLQRVNPAEANGAAFNTRGEFLALTALVAYMLAL